MSDRDAPAGFNAFVHFVPKPRSPGVQVRECPPENLAGPKDVLITKKQLRLVKGSISNTSPSRRRPNVYRRRSSRREIDLIDQRRQELMREHKKALEEEQRRNNSLTPRFPVQEHRRATAPVPAMPPIETTTPPLETRRPTTHLSFRELLASQEGPNSSLPPVPSSLPRRVGVPQSQSCPSMSDVKTLSTPTSDMTPDPRIQSAHVNPFQSGPRYHDTQSSPTPAPRAERKTQRRLPSGSAIGSNIVGDVSSSASDTKPQKTPSTATMVNTIRRTNSSVIPDKKAALNPSPTKSCLKKPYQRTSEDFRQARLSDESLNAEGDHRSFKDVAKPLQNNRSHRTVPQSDSASAHKSAKETRMLPDLGVQRTRMSVVARSTTIRSISSPMLQATRAHASSNTTPHRLQPVTPPSRQLAPRGVVSTRRSDRSSYITPTDLGYDPTGSAVDSGEIDRRLEQKKQTRAQEDGEKDEDVYEDVSGSGQSINNYKRSLGKAKPVFTNRSRSETKEEMKRYMEDWD